MADCRNCGAPVRPAKTTAGEIVPLDNQPEVYRPGDDATDMFRIVDGRVSPMLVEPVNSEVPGQFFRRHACDVRQG